MSKVKKYIYKSKHFCSDTIKYLKEIKEKSTLHDCIKASYKENCVGDGSVLTVHAFGHFASIIDTLGSDAFTAGVVKPAILGAAHGFTVQLTLINGHAVIKVHNRAHCILSIVIAGVDAVAGQ